MVDLIVVCSVTCPECYHALTEKSFKNIGIEYLLIFTDPTISLSESYNSIVSTHKTEIEKSKYIIFLAQDVTLTTENWGKKIIDICDGLPDLGCAGIECVSKNRIQVGFGGNYPEEPVSVNACDGAEVIIPSKLFLERQFDVQFKWYPMMEDYACWIQFVKKLKVYCLPIRIINGGCDKPSKWVSQFANLTEYANRTRIDHDRLLNKWHIEGFPTTTWNVYGHVSSTVKVTVGIPINHEKPYLSFETPDGSYQCPICKNLGPYNKVDFRVHMEQFHNIQLPK